MTFPEAILSLRRDPLNCARRNYQPDQCLVMNNLELERYERGRRIPTLLEFQSDLFVASDWEVITFSQYLREQQAKRI